ncbi:hypothetical protein B0H12DRAFT_1126818 [Mycena haematopus]|nr:hypothetical protein B0H12DRAFT_1126818 [Mycena haematopus]
MSQNSVRAAALALRNVHSSAARTATAGPFPHPPFNPPPSYTPQPDKLTPLRPAAVSASTPPPTSLPNPLVFEGPSGRRPVVRNHHELMQQRPVLRAGSDPVVTIFEGPTHSGRQWRRPVSKSDAKSVRGVRMIGREWTKSWNVAIAGQSPYSARRIMIFPTVYRRLSLMKKTERGVPLSLPVGFLYVYCNCFGIQQPT